jgi:hypothetical protein
MIRLFEERPLSCRSLVADALGKIKDERAVDVLIAELVAPTGDHFLAAAALGRAKCKGAVEPIIAAMLSQKPGRFPNHAYLGPYVKALANIGCQGDRVDDALVFALQSVYSDRKVHQWEFDDVVKSVGKVGGAKTVPLLCMLFANSMTQTWKLTPVLMELETRLGRQVMVELLVAELHCADISAMGAAIVLGKMDWKPTSEEDKSLLKSALGKYECLRNQWKEYDRSAG